MGRLLFIFIFLLSSVSTIFAANQKAPAVFIFGDSLFDSGTNNDIRGSPFKANFPPYGQDFFRKPTGRFCNGRHAADFLTQALGLPFPQPFLSYPKSEQGVNYASGGAGILDSTNAGLGLVTLNQQLRQFAQTKQQLVREHGSYRTNKLLADSIFFITMGANDLFAFLANATTTPERFLTKLSSAYASSIKALYDNGARKIVVFGIGPLGCAPSVMAAANMTSCVAAPNELSLAFNSAMQKPLAALRHLAPASTILFANPFDKFVKLLQKSGVIGACCGAGFLNAQVRCGLQAHGLKSTVCADATKFPFWDANHPSEASAKILADFFWSSHDKSVISPINIAALATNYR